MAPELPSLFFCLLTQPSKEQAEKRFLICRPVFTLFLIEQIFEKKNKSLGVASGIRMRFWSRITPGVLGTYM